jgi:hypothetical protein
VLSSGCEDAVFGGVGDAGAGNCDDVVEFLVTAAGVGEGISNCECQYLHQRVEKDLCRLTSRNITLPFLNISGSLL